MAYAEMIPVVAWLPRGLDCDLVTPVRRCLTHDQRIRRTWKIFRDGNVESAGADEIDYAGTPAEGLHLPATDGTKSAYAEIALASADGSEAFRSRQLPGGIYPILTAPGRKTVMSFMVWKYGATQQITQIAAYGRYVDAYPVVRIDRRRDLAETLVLLNPYGRPIVAELRTQDGRSLGKIRIGAANVEEVNLTRLLRPEEDSWLGQFQLTANNRLITFIVKHSLADPRQITTIEHLDPFRGDPTHIPATRWLRQRIGRLLGR